MTAYYRCCLPGRILPNAAFATLALCQGPDKVVGALPGAGPHPDCVSFEEVKVDLIEFINFARVGPRPFIERASQPL